MTQSFAPTAEQDAALAAYATGDDLIIEAGAGTGKTSTLELLARSDPGRHGQYIAFNKAIVNDAQERMPGHVKASTAHSLAFRAVGYRYADRLNNSRRMRGWEIAAALGIHRPLKLQIGKADLALEDSVLASIVMQAVTNFCQSADSAPGEQHVSYQEGIDLPGEDGKRGWTNNRILRAHVAPFVARAWDDLNRTDSGRLQYKHEHYLKTWQLSGPSIGADVIFFDEAQDVSPVLAAIVDDQTHAQRVYVGDSNQAIYAWLGAIDALARFTAPNRTMLTQSFRFGPAIADVANRVLAALPTDMRLVGTPDIGSVVGPVADADAILCRTNAVAVQELLDGLAIGRRAHMVGGGVDVTAFCRGAEALQGGRRSDHPDLACFTTWGQVQEYVDHDRQGDELRLLVNLVDRFGAGVIVGAIQSMPREDDADLVISTAHKAKGRQWRSVRLACDFNRDDPADSTDEKPGPSDEELRLLYVAVTRARIELDADAVPWVVEADHGKPADGVVRDNFVMFPLAGV